MCGIIGSVSKSSVIDTLLEGLKKLEYRGYDSSGVATLEKNEFGQSYLSVTKAVGKVFELATKLSVEALYGTIGIAHTRWATHGKPEERNAHPHLSCNEIAVVHNGIIENYEALKLDLELKGYCFMSDTDTEVIAHLIHSKWVEDQSLFKAVKRSVKELQGSFAIAVMDIFDQDKLVCAKQGSPLIIGLGVDETLIASDISAVISKTNRIVYLEDGDVAEIGVHYHKIVDSDGTTVKRAVSKSEVKAESLELTGFSSHMEKEMHEQSLAVSDTINQFITNGKLASFTKRDLEWLAYVKNIHIVACGTSYHAGLIGKGWIEEMAGIPCQVEIASEYRYKKLALPPNTLAIFISQSGETADTVGAVEKARDLGIRMRLAICNNDESTLTRECFQTILTRAGLEVGVASTKAFVAQLAALLMFSIVLGRQHNQSFEDEFPNVLGDLATLPTKLKDLVDYCDVKLKPWISKIAKSKSCLYLGRGQMLPIAMEGALKLKELSYIHAEAFATGELKHGPLAMVDANMPIIVLAPSDHLHEKVKSNMQEILARDGKVFLIEEHETPQDYSKLEGNLVIPSASSIVKPLLWVVPLQVIALRVAQSKGLDVDKPRNLAKSVTVE